MESRQAATTYGLQRNQGEQWCQPNDKLANCGSDKRSKKSVTKTNRQKVIARKRVSQGGGIGREWNPVLRGFVRLVCLMPLPEGISLGADVVTENDA